MNQLNAIIGASLTNWYLNSEDQKIEAQQLTVLTEMVELIDEKLFSVCID